MRPEAGPWRRDPPAATALVLLTIAAGAADALTFLHFGGSFVSNQTGTVLLLGINLAGVHVANTAAAVSSSAPTSWAWPPSGGWWVRGPALSHGPTARPPSSPVRSCWWPRPRSPHR